MKYTASDMMYLRDIATAMREVATPGTIHSIILVADFCDDNGKRRATECPELHLELFDLLQRMAEEVEWDEYVLGTRAEFDELIRDGIQDLVNHDLVSRHPEFVQRLCSNDSDRA